MKKNTEEMKFMEKFLYVTASLGMLCWCLLGLWIAKRIEIDWLGMGGLLFGCVFFGLSFLTNEILDEMQNTPEVGDKIIIKSTREIGVVTEIKDRYFIVNNLALTLPDFDLLENNI